MASSPVAGFVFLAASIGAPLASGVQGVRARRGRDLRWSRLPAVPRPVLTRLAVACVASVPVAAVAPASPPAGASEPLLIRSCSTETLTDAEVQAGATSVVSCEWGGTG